MRSRCDREHGWQTWDRGDDRTELRKAGSEARGEVTVWVKLVWWGGGGWFVRLFHRRCHLKSQFYPHYKKQKSNNNKNKTYSVAQMLAKAAPTKCWLKPCSAFHALSKVYPGGPFIITVISSWAFASGYIVYCLALVSMFLSYMELTYTWRSTLFSCPPH